MSMNKVLTEEQLKQLENYIAHVIETDGARGLAVAVINSEGETLYQRCYGFRDVSAGLPYTPQTRQGIASVTKSFTALAIMQLMDRGLVNPEAPVQKYVSEFPHPDVLVRHLLSHSGGYLPMRRKNCRDVLSQLSLPADADPYLSPEAAAAGRQELLEDFAGQKEFTGIPGENFSYSNDSYALLSEIVREYGGETSFAAYLDRYVFSPLGMTGSDLRLVFNTGEESKLYDRLPDGEMSDHWTPADDMSILPGAGGIRSTLEDMKKYVQMYLNYGRLANGSHLVSEYAVREMTRPHITCDLNAYYGYGLMSWATNGMTVWGHGGDQHGVATQIDWSYESGLGCVVLANTSQVTTSAISAAAMRLFSGYPMERSLEGLTPVVWPREKMERLVGTYTEAEENVVELGIAGDIFTVSIDGAQTIAYPINRHYLLTKRTVEDMTVEVHFAEDGSVTAISGGYRIIPKVK
ncbi:MAG: beta-lactamase family protein [Firmicutes bacterium]|nr:beta-lactamase family protein [Bacillota bacterium]